MKIRRGWGTPPNPRQGDPCTPLGWGKGESWGTPPNPRQGDPCTPIFIWEKSSKRFPLRYGGRSRLHYLGQLRPRSQVAGLERVIDVARNDGMLDCRLDIGEECRVGWYVGEVRV